MADDRFTAWALCPHCSSVECHPLRAPREYDKDNPKHRRQKNLSMACGYGDREAPKQLLRYEEQGFEVIRECVSCGHEWGQI